MKKKISFYKSVQLLSLFIFHQTFYQHLTTLSPIWIEMIFPIIQRIQELRERKLEAILMASLIYICKILF